MTAADVKPGTAIRRSEVKAIAATWNDERRRARTLYRQQHPGVVVLAKIFPSATPCVWWPRSVRSPRSRRIRQRTAHGPPSRRRSADDHELNHDRGATL